MNVTGVTNEQLEQLLLDGLEGVQTRLTRAEWAAIRRDAKAQFLNRREVRDTRNTEPPAPND